MKKHFATLALLAIMPIASAKAHNLPSWMGVNSTAFQWCDVEGQGANSWSFLCDDKCTFGPSHDGNCNNPTYGCKTDAAFRTFTFVKDSSACPTGQKMKIAYGWVCGVEEPKIQICVNADKCSIDRDCWNLGYSKETQGCVNGYCDSCATTCTPSTSAWTNTGTTGIQQQTVVRCACDGTKTTSTYYRCIQGYYGMPTTATSGCTRCPTNSAGYTGDTAVPNEADPEDCFLYEGDGFLDTTGRGIYTDDCYWSE